MNLIHALAWCTVCDWRTESRNAMGTAAIHHKKTGHCTMVELGYVQVFGQLDKTKLDSKTEKVGNSVG